MYYELETHIYIYIYIHIPWREIGMEQQELWNPGSIEGWMISLKPFLEREKGKIFRGFTFLSPTLIKHTRILLNNNN